jgi:hypothetical protein
VFLPGYCLLLPTQAFSFRASQQTVDGSHAALEIATRSSYVPSTPIGVRSSGFPEDARPGATRPRLQAWMPVWMKS